MFQTEPYHFLQIIDDHAIKATGLSGDEPVFFLKRGIDMFLMIWGTIAIASRLGWHKQQAT